MALFSCHSERSEESRIFFFASSVFSVIPHSVIPSAAEGPRLFLSALRSPLAFFSQWAHKFGDQNYVSYAINRVCSKTQSVTHGRGF